MDKRKLAEALGADVMIDLGVRHQAMSIGDSLALRYWFDHRRTVLRTAKP